MSETLQFQILTQSGILASTEAKYVSIPGALGEFGVLPGHSPLISTLQSGVLTCETKDKNLIFAVHWGYVEVFENKISILANLAENSEQIDIERAKRAQDKAENFLQELEKQSSDESSQRLKKYEAKLLRSLTRQKTKPF